MPYTLVDENEGQGSYRLLDESTPDSVASRFAKGAISDPITGLAQAAYNALPESVQTAGNKLNNMLAQYGLVAPIPEGGLNELVRQQEAQYNAPEGIDVARIAGNVLSPVNALPAMKLRSAATGLGRVAQGAGLGAAAGLMNPVTSEDYGKALAQNVGLGAAAGGALSGLLSGVSRVISPKASTNPDVAMMRQLGVDVTPGQAMGGAASQLEQKLTSVPVMGDLIANRRQTALEQFNTSMFNKAGQPIGFKTDKKGFEALADLDTAVSQAYKKAVDATPSVRVDTSFLERADNLSRMAEDVADLGATKQALDKQIAKLWSQVSKADQILPDTWKQMDAKLGDAARSTKNMDYKNALRQLQVEWRDMAARSNPEQRGLFKQADAAYSNLVRLEKASDSALKAEGVFTPNQLGRAAQRMAPSKTQKRQGTAPFLAEAQAAERVLGNTVPNSGTFDRALAGGGLAGLAAVNPLSLLAPAVGAAMYTSPINKLLTQSIVSRSPFAEPLAKSIGQTAPIAGLLGAQAIQ